MRQPRWFVFRYNFLQALCLQLIKADVQSVLFTLAFSDELIAVQIRSQQLRVGIKSRLRIEWSGCFSICKISVVLNINVAVRSRTVLSGQHIAGRHMSDIRLIRDLRIDTERLTDTMEKLTIDGPAERDHFHAAKFCLKFPGFFRPGLH